MANDLTMPQVASWYKRKAVVISAMIAVLIIVLGGVAWFFMQPSEDVEPTPVIDITPLYIGAREPFIFSIVAGRHPRLVQVEVQLLVRGEKSSIEAQRHLPLLESTLLSVFSRQSADNYITADGKQALRKEAVNELNAVLTEELGTPLIEKVLFTSIVMQ
ncbi:flagellar basal body-associated FliL family protein [Oceanisphaera ostreae]|uniref:Flagellar protein FliL n=1 Tax=Oceanisphaera ostreae TaxID=914151 RepID=A0ABW3KEX6_9GAMM